MTPDIQPAVALPMNADPIDALKLMFHEEHVKRVTLEVEALKVQIESKIADYHRAESERDQHDTIVRSKYQMGPQDSISFDTERDIYQIVRR